MGFGGSSAAMIQSLRDNKKLLSERIPLFKQNFSYKKRRAIIAGKKKLSPEEFAVIKKGLIRKKRIQTMLLLTLLTAFITFTTIIVSWLL